VAIVDVTIAYCWAIDERRRDVLGDGFLPNATAILGAPELPGARGVPTRDETRR
jgi:hypothetical protein